MYVYSPLSRDDAGMRGVSDYIEDLYSLAYQQTMATTQTL